MKILLNSYNQCVVSALREVKTRFSKIDVIVGNIATPEAAKFLVENGTDGVKAVIDSGFICTSRCKQNH